MRPPRLYPYPCCGGGSSEALANVFHANGTVSYITTGSSSNGGISINTNSMNISVAASPVNGSYFYTGETVPIMLHITQQCRCAGDNIIGEVDVKNASSGFLNIGTTPNLPLRVDANTEANVTVYFKAPDTQFDGLLALFVGVSGSAGIN